MKTTTVYRDFIPASLRKQWAEEGLYASKPLYTRFAEFADKYPDDPAVIDDDGTVSYRELRQSALRLAAALRDAGVESGDVVASSLPNGRHACMVDLAAAAIGAIVLPYPVSRGPRETRAMLSRSGAVALIAESSWNDVDYRQVIDDLRGDLPALKRVIWHDAAGTNELGTLIEATRAPWQPDMEPDPDAPARILVTSGSEAEPKMVLYSHNALADGRGAFVANLHRGTRPMRNYFLVPLASSFGSSGTSVTLAQMGGTLVLRRRFDPDDALGTIATSTPSHVLGVPAMFQKMLASPLWDGPVGDRPNTDSLIALVSGGAGVDPATIDACTARFGCAFVNLYGSADGINCHTSLDDPPDIVKTTVGRPNPSVTTIRVVDPAGHDCAPGTVGELWSRGPMSPLCYVNAPELDARYRTADGWVRTGDQGSLGQDGRLRLHGRKKEIIIRGGLNIIPAEVEQHLNSHPAVLRAVCLAVPDPLLGERICACVVPTERDAPPSLHALTAFLATERHLERHTLPEYLFLVDEFPVNPVGKTDKHALRAMAAARIADETAKPRA